MTQAVPASRQPQDSAHWVGVAILGIMVIAILVRGWHLQTWSMWEDEEGSLRLAQTPYHGFAGYFPIFFVYLNQQIAVTGLSVGLARLFPALMGVLSVGLTFGLSRRFCSAPVALLGSGLIALNLGHVFFSQSIRYYTLALDFQIIALFCFLDGHERGRTSTLICSLGFWILALLTHFSALLLGPALLCYLGFVCLHDSWRRQYGVARCFVSLAGVAGVLLVFGLRMLELRGMIGGWVITSQRDPWHIATTVVAYFGVPVLVLAAAAPWVSCGLSPRVVTFLFCAAAVPLMELIVLAALNVVNVTWYYALIALVPCALLAGATLSGLWQRRYRRVAIIASTCAAAYYAVFLAAYHLEWHGDRPRWSEAAAFLQSVQVAQLGERAPTVYSNVPGVVAFYLGADPRNPDSYKSVTLVPRTPPPGTEPFWVVLEANAITPTHRAWLERSCRLMATFQTHTGPVNRSVFVYRSGEPSASAVRLAAVLDE